MHFKRIKEEEGIGLLLISSFYLEHKNSCDISNDLNQKRWKKLQNKTFLSQRGNGIPPFLWIDIVSCKSKDRFKPIPHHFKTFHLYLNSKKLCVLNSLITMNSFLRQNLCIFCTKHFDLLLQTELGLQKLHVHFLWVGLHWSVFF